MEGKHVCGYATVVSPVQLLFHNCQVVWAKSLRVTAGTRERIWPKLFKSHLTVRV